MGAYYFYKGSNGCVLTAFCVYAIRVQKKHLSFRSSLQSKKKICKKYDEKTLTKKHLSHVWIAPLIKLFCSNELLKIFSNIPYLDHLNENRSLLSKKNFTKTFMIFLSTRKIDRTYSQVKVNKTFNIFFLHKTGVWWSISHTYIFKIAFK